LIGALAIFLYLDLLKLEGMLNGLQLCFCNSHLAVRGFALGLCYFQFHHSALELCGYCSQYAPMLACCAGEEFEGGVVRVAQVRQGAFAWVTGLHLTATGLLDMAKPVSAG
jgi:hypothetical protein